GVGAGAGAGAVGAGVVGPGAAGGFGVGAAGGFGAGAAGGVGTGSSLNTAYGRFVPSASSASSMLSNVAVRSDTICPSVNGSLVRSRNTIAPDGSTSWTNMLFLLTTRPETWYLQPGTERGPGCAFSFSANSSVVRPKQRSVSFAILASS